MFLEGTVIIISLVVSIRSTLLQVMTQIPVQNDIIIIIPIYNFRVDIQDMEEKRKKQKHKFNQRQTQKVRALLMSAIERESGNDRLYRATMCQHMVALASGLVNANGKSVCLCGDFLQQQTILLCMFCESESFKRKENYEIINNTKKTFFYFQQEIWLSTITSAVICVADVTHIQE